MVGGIMAKGGPRNRSGPKADPNSGRSEIRGYTLTALPAEGFDGDVPDFPGHSPSGRELHWWAWAWSTPQACAWSLPSERWRVPFVAEWCTAKADLEVERTASMLAQKFRMEDRIGFSTAGLAEMGWRVAVDDLAPKRAEQAAADAPAPARRMRAVSDGA